MLIEFIDAPVGISSAVAVAVQANATEIVAKQTIEAAWNNWLAAGNGFPAPAPCNCDLADMANALLLDNNNAMPLAAAQNLIATFVDVRGNDLVYQPHLWKVSQRLKSVGSEFFAMAASIVVAHANGLQYMGCRPHVNSLFGIQVWQKPWNSSGPDFLCYDNACDATFIEVKGSMSGFTTPAQPVASGFVDDKLQSINAKLVLPAFLPQVAARFVLSRVGSNAAGILSVQWFNDRQERTTNGTQEPCTPLALAVALSNAYIVLEALDVRVIVGGSRVGAYIGPLSRNGAALSDITDSSAPRVFIHADVTETLLKAQQWFEVYRNTAEPSVEMLEVAKTLWNRLNVAMEPDRLGRDQRELSNIAERRVVQLSIGIVALE